MTACHCECVHFTISSKMQNDESVFVPMAYLKVMAQPKIAIAMKRNDESLNLGILYLEDIWV